MENTKSGSTDTISKKEAEQLSCFMV